MECFIGFISCQNCYISLYWVCYARRIQIAIASIVRHCFRIHKSIIVQINCYWMDGYVFVNTYALAKRSAQTKSKLFYLIRINASWFVSIIALVMWTIPAKAFQKEIEPASNSLHFWTVYNKISVAIACTLKWNRKRSVAH